METVAVLPAADLAPLTSPTLASAALAVRLGLSGDELALVAEGTAGQLARLPGGGRRGFAVDAETGAILRPGEPLPEGRRLFASVRITLSGPAEGQGGALETIAALAGNGWSLEAAPELRPALDRSVAAVRARPADLPAAAAALDGEGVLVGVVDFGCDFAHPSFRDEAGLTRLRLLWDQNGPGEAEGFGRVFGGAAIDAALAANDPYAALQYWPDRNIYAPALAHKDGVVHGTHVLGVAAGRGVPECPAGVAPGADLAFVHLRPGALVSCGDAADVFDGVCEIFRFAADRAMPAVVNLSLGANWGSHDGNMLYDAALDALLAAPGRAIVVAAGNERLARLNIDGEVRLETAATLRWQFDTGDRTDNTLRIFAAAPAGVPALTCTVRLGSTETALAPGSAANARWLSRGDGVGGGGATGVAYTGLAPGENGGALQHIEIRLTPTGEAETVEIVLSTASLVPISFDAWIERDDRRNASQSCFALDTPSTRSSLACTACGRRTLTVGAFQHRDPARSAAPFSSEGLTRDGRRKPDVSAPGCDVLGPAAYGGRTEPGQPWRRGLATRMTGTSVAAPHAAGVCALLLQARPALTADECGALLRDTACREGLPAEGWHPQLGAGRLDAAAALARLSA